MSDCSTQAMMPKDPPSKRQVGYVLRWEIDDPNDNMSQVTEVQVNNHRFVQEQRYQQMEHVAKDMLLSFHQANGISWLDDENYKRVVSTLIAQCVDDYIGELRELGVFPPPARSTGGEH